MLVKCEQKSGNCKGYKTMQNAGEGLRNSSLFFLDKDPAIDT